MGAGDAEREYTGCWQDSVAALAAPGCRGTHAEVTVIEYERRGGSLGRTDQRRNCGCCGQRENWGRAAACGGRVCVHATRVALLRGPAARLAWGRAVGGISARGGPAAAVAPADLKPRGAAPPLGTTPHIPRRAPTTRAARAMPRRSRCRSAGSVGGSVGAQGGAAWELHRSGRRPACGVQRSWH